MTSEKNVSSKKGRPLITPTTDLGRFIRTKRIECGFTQTELADLSKTSAPNISMIESGTRHYTSMIVANALAIALNCTIEEIIRYFPQKKQATYVHPLGRFIHARCLELNYTLADIVRKSNLTAGIIDRLMHTKTIRQSVIEPLARVLACEKSELAQFLQKRSTTISSSPVGKLLQDKRKTLNLTLAEVGFAVSLTRERVRQIESSGKIPLKHRGRFIQVLRIDPIELQTLQVHDRRSIKKTRVHEIISPLVRWFAEQRIARGWAQHLLAEKMGYARSSSVNEFEKERQLPTRSFVENMARALDVNIPEELLIHIAPEKDGRKKYKQREVLAFKCLFIGMDLNILVKRGWTIEATDPDGKKYDIKIL